MVVYAAFGQGVLDGPTVSTAARLAAEKVPKDNKATQACLARLVSIRLFSVSWIEIGPREGGSGAIMRPR